MPTPAASHALRTPTRSIADTALQVGLLALLIYACSRIVLPFTSVLLWSVVLAVLLHPLHVRLSVRLGNRWSAVVIGLVGVAVILVPMVIAGTSLASSISALVSALQNHTLTVPPPPPKLATIPVIGQKLTETWALASTNAPAVLAKYGPNLKVAAAWLVSFAGRFAAGELMFILSFVVAAILIAYGKPAADFARRMLEIVTGSRERGTQLVTLTAATVRGVLIGVVGVAAIQSALLGIGFFAIGLPGAGLVTLVVLLLGIVQVPATLLTLPIIAYVLATKDTGPAVIFAVWTLVAGLSDNILKPLMLGRGMEVPMPIILIGVIGGMVADGLLGLFVGPVLLAVAYVLFVEWLRRHPAEDGDQQVVGPKP